MSRNQQTVSVIVQLILNEHDFHKQPFINVLQNTCNSVKKKPQQRCFLVHFAKFLRTPFLQNTSGQLHLDFFIHFTAFYHRVN